MTCAGSDPSFGQTFDRKHTPLIGTGGVTDHARIAWATGDRSPMEAMHGDRIGRFDLHPQKS